MAKYDYDLFVIGAGSGGVRAARLAAVSGAKVAIAEEHRVGGTCVIRGCVPKKFMVYASEFAHHFKTSKSYGWTIESAHFDWEAFLVEKDKEIARLSGIYVRNLQVNAGAELAHGQGARLLDAHTVQIDKIGTRTAAKFLIATGGRPWMPPELPGVELGHHVQRGGCSTCLLNCPSGIVIAGGGYIAVEFAGIFNGLGVDTTLVHRGPNLLRGFDDDVRSHLAEELEKRGVKVVLGAQHTAIEKSAGGLISKVERRPTRPKVMSSCSRWAVSSYHRWPWPGDDAGVKLTDRGAVAVDEYSRTNIENIWAVGDVTDRINLTPVAIREGQAFAETEFYAKPTKFDHEMVASAVFSQPSNRIGGTEPKPTLARSTARSISTSHGCRSR